MPAIRIVGLAILAAVVYGIALDQVTARVCIEYFTVGHPRIFPTGSPTLLALGWGVIGTWWVGFLLGIPLAIAATRGGRPRRSAASLVRPIGLLLLAMSTGAGLAGIAGYGAAEAGWVFLIEPVASRVAADRHSPFIADLWAHLASYGVGFLGGAVLIVRVWRSRVPTGIVPSNPSMPADRPSAGR